MSHHASPSGGWQVEHSASEAYEQYLVPPIFAPWAERLLETVDVESGEQFLDLACGTGIVARRGAARVGEDGSVVGLDINEDMLATARNAAGDRADSITWKQGDATDLPFDDGHFDVVCCQQALQFFEEPGAALAEVHRVLRPGGRAAASVWRPLAFQPAYVALADALERHVRPEAGAMMRSPFPDWDGATLREHFRGAGFADVSITVEIGSVRYPSVATFVRREAASSPLAESIAALDREPREALLEEVAEALEGYRDDDGIVSPMESFVVRADR